MDLFDMQREGTLAGEQPLAARLRPKALDEFVGQREVVGKGTLLYRAITADKLRSVIFHGPPGTGKTTLAQIIANTTKSDFQRLNATTSGVKDVKAVVEGAKALLGMTGRRTILFIDEIHRFNKAQQDALLPHVEDGTVILIGATTENPYFEVNKALLSRSLLFRLNALSTEDILGLLRRATTAEGGVSAEVTEEALAFIADTAGGDARMALNALELAVVTTEAGAGGLPVIDLAVAQDCIQRRAVLYDKDGDSHYDTISAFIKSMRGSDPDAALYYLARMIEAGEDPRFIARRIVICASEDVGNADPHALLVAEAAARAADFVGWPESGLIFAQAVTYIACAPKSNSALGIFKAMEDAKRVRIGGVPAHLRDNHSSQADNPQSAYKYPHAFPGHYTPQQYLPDELVGRVYYEPSENGVEKRIGENLRRLREANPKNG